MSTSGPLGLDGAPGRATAVRSGRERVPALLLGALTGLTGLLGMARLAAGAFDGQMSRIAWFVVLAAMVPWVVYTALRAAHGRLAGVRLVVVAALVVAGMTVVWWSALGQVLALSCSLAAFVVIWVSDWPTRRPAGHDRFVRIEELRGGDDTD